MATTFKIRPILQRKLPEIDHFFSQVSCFGHKIPQDESFSKPFSPLIYILTIFSRDTRKGQTYGDNWSGHNAQYGHIGHYGRYGATNYGHKFDLHECPWKI